ncbi:MAG: LLM class flavin-dependent oxidoreductase [Hyphomicrobiaceae bacterium TMED74]|nr:LLM class flavin-dependent oxidoreductase [Filomicrobium sp.]RPG42162.1 MAG: LLM class flavin-dependent oxidoreductase [Hyphomicrobiaceae bacterium TMED74]
MVTTPKFASQIGAVDRLGASKSDMYREAIEDAKYAQELGFESVWMVEHHFSDYYPTPNPLMFLSHLAAAVPGMGLGTAVMVLPWYDPVRFAEDTAMLASLATGPLHIGMGRGTAKLEYDALRVDMNEARERFQECWEVMQLALKGEPFTYEGRYLKLDRPITIRPHLDPARQINFLGAIGSPGSAEIMADLGLKPLSLSQFPDYMLVKIIERWTAKAKSLGYSTDGMMPVSTKCFIADSATSARDEAREHMARFYKLQAEHYTTDTTPWDDIKGYEQFAKIFANMKLMGDPAQNDPILDRNLIGSPETVATRINELRAIGFNYFLISNAMHGVEREVRHRMMRRFANEVIPLVGSLPVPEAPVFEKVSAAE